ncbi:radical SAM protein [Methylomonas methanica]|uniref:Radical SAM domain protein n=1 Tax=Methylomonas methanica (strain DSM 25384 / MC09) TaxID=857087 RepID=G0A462_METMM|nr:radical SAM protein [Methylomonas methanica]AEF99109.1 Radical SAM domain protein [Methylomonas methanica MC09]
MTLTTTNHDRDVAGLKYIYPVISRRAGGLSIGVNFNPNNACNWRCIYCQVPDLQRGAAPAMDLALLDEELRFFLNYVQQGDFFEQYQLAPEQRVVKDIAISGNGEPTSLENFEQAVTIIGDIANEAGVFPDSHFVLITNGSLIHQASTQAGLKQLDRYHGEVWFKLDSATEQGRKLINNSVQSQQKLLENLQTASRLCSTKLQTCVLHFDEQTWTEPEKRAYLQLLRLIQEQRIKIEKIMLYTIARQSFQPEAAKLIKADLAEMNALAADIKAMGFDVSVSA